MHQLPPLLEFFFLCVSAFLRACVRACVRAYVRVCARAYLCVPSPSPSRPSRMTLALAMGRHRRLGAASPVRHLDDLVLSIVLASPARPFPCL